LKKDKNNNNCGKDKSSKKRREIYFPTKDEFIKGIKEFEKNEKRDVAYKVSIFFISQFWGCPRNMAYGIGTLLLVWNNSFYRYRIFDFDKLEECIKENLEKLSKFKKRNITTLSESDELEVENIFNEFLEALKISDNKKSPVAVAKALHLLAPNFFPLWDSKIAKAYGCNYHKNDPAKEYIKFMKLMKELTKHVTHFINLSYYPNKTILKLIDEYNYAKYTKKWI